MRRGSFPAMGDEAAMGRSPPVRDVCASCARGYNALAQVLSPAMRHAGTAANTCTYKSARALGCCHAPDAGPSSSVTRKRTWRGSQHASASA